MTAAIGIGTLLLGFLLGMQPLLTVAVAALATGACAGMTPLAMLQSFGHAFNASRYVSVIYVVLPLIGLLECHGLQERARALIGGLRGATLARLLIGYMLLRQLSAGLGLISIAGHPQTVRPLLAPMAETAAEADRPLAEAARERIRALAAATDNVGLFFGEDMFLAIGSILLMKAILEAQGIAVEPLAMSIWAIPVAAAALLIHGARVTLFARGLRRSA